MVDLPDVRFQASYPQVVDSVSVSRAGKRVVSRVEYADPFWQVVMTTKPLRASERMKVEAFRDACRGGMVSVLYKPKHMCLPMAYWGNPTAPALANGTLSAKAGFNATLAATSGLVLSGGDLISLSIGTHNWIARIVTGGISAAGSIAVTLNMPLPPFIALGAVVRFRDIRMNTMLLPDSFTMPDTLNPVASFTLVEVP